MGLTGAAFVMSVKALLSVCLSVARQSVCISCTVFMVLDQLTCLDMSGPELTKTCLLVSVFSPSKLASLTGKVSVRLLGTLIEPFAGV